MIRPENDNNNQFVGSDFYSVHSQDNQEQDNFENGAIRRSYVGQEQNNISNNNNNQGSFKNNLLIIEIDQSPPLYWMFFLMFGIVQIIMIILIGNYYVWDDLNKPSNKGDDTLQTLKNLISKNYKSLQDINIMIYLGFGFLRILQKHYSWTSLSLIFIGGVLSFEFGLFALICWSAIIRKSWYNGIINFQHFIDATYCAATTVISLGAILGKLSFAQYFVTIFFETVFSSFNYILLRQCLEIIDVGGCLSVHLFGAIFGGIFSLVSFSLETERKRINQSAHFGTKYYSNVLGLFGTLIVLSYWPSFNTCLINDANQKYRGIINTYLSIGGSIISTIAMDLVYYKKNLKIEDVLNSTYAGGIVVSGCCNIIKEFWACIIFGLFAGGITSFLYFILYERLKNKGYHDTYGIFYYHGIPAFIGGIISTIFVGNLTNWEIKENLNYYIGKILDYSNYSFTDNYSQRAGIQFACIFITIFIAAASGLMAGFSIKFCNCDIALTYFNDHEFFEVEEKESFPWKDEEIQLKLCYNSKKGRIHN